MKIKSKGGGIRTQILASYYLKRSVFYIILSCLCHVVQGQDLLKDTVQYKMIEEGPLIAEVIRSEQIQDDVPAMLFYFGGGWKSGNIDHLRPQAEYLARKGLVSILVQYRTESSHGTTPIRALEDAVDAIHYFTVHGIEYGIDTSRIAAAGGSAGGHLAAATALCESYNATGARPDALVLYNPVIDNGPDGYGYERVSESFPGFSPMHNIRQGAPPTLFFLGDADALIPVRTAYEYQRKMDSVSARCDLLIYPEQSHGFFNPRNPQYFDETLFQTHVFLYDLGYVDNPPNTNHAIILGHAHNDYRHSNPLKDALAQGFRSVEADILPKDGKLWVGHDRIELTHKNIKELQELYLQPLFDRYQAGTFPFDQDYPSPFYLWIDIKYAGDSTYDVLRKAIVPYKSMLASIKEGRWQEGAVQIILSGDRPFNKMQFEKVEYFFLDGRPLDLENNTYTSLEMPFISENIDRLVGPVSNSMTAIQIDQLEKFVDDCHGNGYKVRCWNTPDNSISWDQLSKAGVDLINTDLLKSLHAHLFNNF